jgi:hydrogenase-4 component B
VANGGFGWVAPLWIALGLVALLLAIPLALRLIGANNRRRYYVTWGCGRALQTARFEYTATAFANPFKRVFAVLYRPVKDLDIEFHPESRYFVRTIDYDNPGHLIFEDKLYRPLLRMIEAAARRARGLQSGNVHGYLVYILIALITLLIVTA